MSSEPTSSEPTVHVSNLEVPHWEERNPKYIVQAAADEPKYPVEDTSARPVEAAPAPAPAPSLGQRLWARKWLLAGIGTIIIIAVVLGAVLGSVLHHHGSGSGSKSSSTGPSSTSNAGASSSPSPSSTTTSTAAASSKASTSTTATPTASPTMSGSATRMTNFLYPTAISTGFPHLEVLAMGYDYQVYWAYRDSATGEWTPNGALSTISSTVIQWENGVTVATVGSDDDEEVQLYAVGQGNSPLSLYRKVHNSTMQWDPAGSWEQVPSYVDSAASIVSWEDDPADVYMFVLDIYDGLYYATYSAVMTSGIGAWQYLGGTWTQHYTPTVVSWNSTRFDVFVVDPTTSAVRYTYWDGSDWQPGSQAFYNLHGYSASRPVAASWGPGRIDLFTRGGDGGLWHLVYDDDTTSTSNNNNNNINNNNIKNWSNWTRISTDNTTIQAEPEVVSWGPGRLDVFAWGTDNSLYHKAYEDGKWQPAQGFDVLGSDLGGPPKAVSDAQGSVHVFAYSKAQSLIHKAWNQTLGAWSPDSGFEILGYVA